MLILQLILVVTMYCFKISGEVCSMGFPEIINMRGITMELDTIPEDTEVLIPSLRITCDGYISHVSVGYKVIYESTINQDGVYLQLWRTAVGTRNYSLIEEVLLPVGEPWPGNNNQSILKDFELPSRIAVQSNDVIGFRTPWDSSVEVLVDTTDQWEILEYESGNPTVLNVTGIPQIIITNRRTCNRHLPNNINVSANDNEKVPFQSVSGNLQVIFPSVRFTCDGNISQITGWYQIFANDSNISASIQFQIWHPISNSQYKLVSEASLPSALNDQPTTVDNLKLQFYTGSVVGVYIEAFEFGSGTLTLLKDDDVPHSLLYVTNDKPCIFDTTITGLLSVTTIDIEIVVDYAVSNEDVDQTFYCEQDDEAVGGSKKKPILIISAAAIVLILTIIILMVTFTCCWRRYRSLGRTRRYFEPGLIRSNKLFGNIEYNYYNLDSHPEVKSLASASYATISDNATIKSFIKTPGSDFEQICSELTEVEISPDEIELGNEIGSGNSSVVYHGVWNHKIIGTKDQVAVKTLHSEISKEEKIKLLGEAATIQQFLHNNIIKFYGVITSGESIMIVLEYLPNGSLLSYLRSARPKEGELVNQLLPQVLLKFAREIGCGMNYLSNKSFIHRDLAARNILLSEENVCKIADFGLSRDLDEDDYYIAQGGFIPVRWTAPEALLFRSYATSSDIWSYGIVLYEMWSLGEKPYGDYDNTEVLKLIGTGYRLPPPPGCARQIYNLMIQCWNPVHRLRPSFSAVLKTISQPPYVLFHWFEEDREAAGSQCDVLGAPLEAGHNLFLDLQNAYK